MTQVLVLNFGSQVAHLICRRVRELGVYAEIVPHTVSKDEILAIGPKCIILSGGPSSVYVENAPLCDQDILNLDVPILGICYGHQLIARCSKGKVSNKKIKEFGKKILWVKKESDLLKGIGHETQVWMSHGDSVEELPNGFITLASTDTCRIAAFANTEHGLYGVQFHPEVAHTPKGRDMLANFIFRISRCKKDYSVDNLKDELIQEIRESVGSEHVLMAISGGVDSTVAAVLISEAIGKHLHCVFIDHGLLRYHEKATVEKRYKKFNLDINYVDASQIFMSRLKGVTDPEEKRKAIGYTFIEVFEREAKKLEKRHPKIGFLAQGTIYPDRIESAQPNKQADKIKSHHNLTLPEKMHLKILEPLKNLYKDGVRELGAKLNIPDEILNRHPFPGPGLAIRILGEITGDRLEILRNADKIYMDELKKNKQYRKIWQAFAALLPVKSVGVMGDARTYEYIIALRAVTSLDAMTADWAKIPNGILEHISNRIINEVRGVNRVVYDITQKPPGTIEYE
ncbi:MAG: glutamine-hydrolyzing GMP synthase [archaeon]